jgi:hypothetical protein
MSTGALFHNEMSKTTGVGMSILVIPERVLARWWCLVAFMKDRHCPPGTLQPPPWAPK